MADQVSVQNMSGDVAVEQESADLSQLQQDKQTVKSSGGRQGRWSTRNTRDDVTRKERLHRTMSLFELHQCCRETIERCTKLLRERERKMERLQLLLPLSSSVQRADRHCATRPSKKKKLNASSLLLKRETNLSAWPLASVKSRACFGVTTVSPLVNRNSKNQTQVRYPLRATLNNPPSLVQTKENEEGSNQETTPIPSHAELDFVEKTSRSPDDLSTILPPHQQDFKAVTEDETCNENKQP